MQGQQQVTHVSHPPYTGEEMAKYMDSEEGASSMERRFKKMFQSTIKGEISKQLAPVLEKQEEFVKVAKKMESIEDSLGYLVQRLREEDEAKKKGNNALLGVGTPPGNNG